MLQYVKGTDCHTGAHAGVAMTQKMDSKKILQSEDWRILFEKEFPLLLRITRRSR